MSRQVMWQRLLLDEQGEHDILSVKGDYNHVKRQDAVS